MTMLLAAIVCGFLGCEGDGDKPYGFEQVYMPQAARTDTYDVPSGGGEFTHNFVIEEGEVRIILGVSRAGSGPYKNYSVDIAVDYAATQEFVSEDAGRMILPESIYILPENVTVANGALGESFYLSVYGSELKKPVYNNKYLVLCVAVENPSTYELAEESCMTTVVIDVTQIRKFL